MKTLKKTVENRAYSEEEAKEFLDQFRANAGIEGYVVGANGYKYRCKKSKGEIVDQAWICTCTAVYNEIWDQE